MEGDGHVPGGSIARPDHELRLARKVRACAACRSLKIKCNMPTAEPPCARCQTKGFLCVLDKDEHIWAKEYSNWKPTVDERVAQLQNAINVLLHHNRLPGLASYSGTSEPQSSPDNHGAHRSLDSGDDDLSLALSSRTSQPPVLDATVFHEPMNSLYEVTRLRALRTLVGKHSKDQSSVPTTHDLISMAVISLEKAEDLFGLFKRRLNHFLYGILCPYETLKDLRGSSPLLTTSVCTIAALHDPDCTGSFDACQREFLNLAARTMFSHSPSIDDMRAFTIGTFWLSNVSWTLGGHAIRMATGLQYHQAFYRALEGSQPHYQEAQLWYVLYILDHHWSIIYGRPPMLHESEAFRRWGDFIQCPFATEADVRISSQVALFLITERVFETYSGDNSKTIPEMGIGQSRVFNAELDTWYRTWGKRLQENPALGQFPESGVTLHYHFAKIYVCLHVFRGQSLEKQSETSIEVKQNAVVAINSAMSVLDLILQRPELCSALVGVHVYFHAMIAYSAMFLLKALMRFPAIVHVDATRIFGLIEQIVIVFKGSEATKNHLAYHIADGLEKLLDSCKSEGMQDISDANGNFQFTGIGSEFDASAAFEAFNMYSQLPLSSGLDMFFTGESHQ